MKSLINTNEHGKYRRNHGLTQIIGIALIIISVFSVPRWLNTYDKGNETVIVLGKVSYTPYQDEYEKMLYPTVRISTPGGTGSGVVIELKEFIESIESKESNSKNSKNSKNPTNYILTAAHVVGNENKVEIEFFTTKNTKSTKIDASVIITDTDKDLALIKPQINTDFTDKIYSAKLADKDYIPYLFHPVWAVGCSLGLDPRPSYGHITRVHEFSSSRVQGSTNELMNSRACELFWEISAPILPGNSGGPVYDAHTYEVIGIAVWVKVYDYQLITTMAGIVPINQIYEFLNESKK